MTPKKQTATAPKAKAKPLQAPAIDAVPDSIQAHHREEYLELLAELRRLPEFNRGKLIVLQSLFVHMTVIAEASKALADEGVVIDGPTCRLQHPAVTILNGAVDRVTNTLATLGLVQKPRRQADPKASDSDNEGNPWQL